MYRRFLIFRMTAQKGKLGIRLFMIITALICLLGCESNENVYPEAKAVADQYFVAAKAGNVESILPLYHASFFEKRTRDTWREEVSHLWKQLGVPFENTLESASVAVSPLGTEVTLSYSVGYSGGMLADMSPGVEVLTFITPTTGGPIRWIGHTYRNNAAR